MVSSSASLTRRRRRRSTPSWALGLSLLLVAQALFPLQAHTRWVEGEDGGLVLLCTIDGLRAVSADEKSPGREGGAGDDLRVSPACLFSQLMAGATPAVAGLQDLPPARPAVGLRAPRTVPVAPGRAERAHAIRAPPA